MCIYAPALYQICQFHRFNTDSGHARVDMFLLSRHVRKAWFPLPFSKNPLTYWNGASKFYTPLALSIVDNVVLLLFSFWAAHPLQPAPSKSNCEMLEGTSSLNPRYSTVFFFNRLLGPVLLLHSQPS